MRKSYSFLEKKLQEIEQAHAQNEDIKPRIEFLKRLISSELSPHPFDSIPRPLRIISEQLTRLDSGHLKDKHHGTATSIDDRDKVSPDSCSSEEDNNDPMPELETVKALPVNAEFGDHEKSRGLKIYCCGCLVIMMISAVFFVMGSILMLSFCGCSDYYYHNNIRLQHAPGFITPT